MQRSAAGLVLVMWWSVFAASAGYAQGKKPCDFITKSDAESILGSPVNLGKDNQYNCQFAEPGFSKAPKNKQISLSVWYAATPDPTDYAVRRKNIVDYKTASDIVKDVAGFADAAVWKWTPGWGGSFVAFKGGIIQTEVVISGLPEDAALQSAKTLAAKVLGGSAKTGYAYAGASGSPAPVISAVTAAGPVATAAKSTATSTASTGNKTIRGTVSRVSVDFDNPQHWMSIFFKEQPESSFVVCSPDPQMFRETIADLYTLVGKTMEVTGQVEKSQCAYRSQADSIRVEDSQHFRVLLPPAAPRRVVTADKAPRRAEPRVGLNICNDGKIDFDAFAQMQQAGVTSAHVVPGDCVHVYEGQGTPAFIGLAFADSRGQWGAPRRLDLLPGDVGFGIGAARLWSKAEERVSVKHGAGSVSLPMQLLFTPEVPACTSSGSSEVGVFGANVEETQKIRDTIRAQSTNNQTTCDSFEHTLNVVAYADTREVTFETKCFACPHDATVTPGDVRRGVARISQIAPMLGQFAQIAGKAAALGEEDQLRESLDGPPEFEHMNWTGMNQALGFVRPALGRPPEMPQYLTIRGTISRVDVSPPGASVPWVNVWFRESAEQRSNAFETFYGPFNACASSPELFEDAFGPDFRTRMIGQVVELEGEFQRYYCKGWKGSVRISLAHQIRKAAALDPADIKAQAKQ
jgi:hypothetical protein